MTDETTVAFSTGKHSDIPRIGQRKRVRVNGHDETLYVKEVRAEVKGSWDDEGRYRRHFEGRYMMVPFENL